MSTVIDDDNDRRLRTSHKEELMLMVKDEEAREQERKVRFISSLPFSLSQL